MGSHFCERSNRHTTKCNCQTKKILANSKNFPAPCLQSVVLKMLLKLIEKSVSYHFTCIENVNGLHAEKMLGKLFVKEAL